MRQITYWTPSSMNWLFLQVYDVNSFVSKHPGGVDQILCGAGRDITQVFESYHNTEVAKQWVSQP